MTFSGLCLIWLLVAPVLGVPIDDRSSSDLPSKDIFYVVPDNIDQFPLGGIIRHRAPPNPIALLGQQPLALESAHQILYRTNDNFGNATATILTVLIPENADYGKLLSYQTAEDSAAQDCAPSYGLQLRHKRVGGTGLIGSGAEILLMQSALERGWVVITPDHEGPNAAFLANRRGGYSVLDGIRAALQSGDFTGIERSATSALWGYSGGAFVSGWAAELQPKYAPEINLAGAAIGGLTPDIINVMKTVNGRIPAGLIPAGLMGLSAEYPAIGKRFQSLIQPEYREMFENVKSQCVVNDLLDFQFRDVLDMVADRSVWFNDPEFTQIIEDNNLGHAAPTTPLFVYKSIHDEVSPVEDTDTLVDFYCSKGASVQYHRDSLSEHGVLAVTGAARALAFLIDVMDEKVQPPGCSTRTVASTLFEPVALRLLPKYLLSLLLAFTGNRTGPL